MRIYTKVNILPFIISIMISIKFKFSVIKFVKITAKIPIPAWTIKGFTNVRKFSSGELFLAEKNDVPDLVFLDYNLGDLTGLELLLRIKRSMPTTQVIMVSSEEKERVKNDAIEFGAKRFITKGNISMNAQIDSAIYDYGMSVEA